MNRFRHFLVAGAFLAAVSGLQAQNPIQGNGLQPVEHLIEDRDPLRFSLRRLDNGLGAMGQESRIYRGSQSGFGQDSRLNLVSPGIWAESDRSQYVQATQGKLKGLQFQAIAPNTVFHLAPPKPEIPQGLPRESRPNQLRADLNASLDGRVRPVFNGPAGGPEGFEDRNIGPVDPEIQEWRDYDRLVLSSRRNVLLALDELRNAALTPAEADSAGR